MGTHKTDTFSFGTREPGPRGEQAPARTGPLARNRGTRILTYFPGFASAFAVLVRRGVRPSTVEGY